MLNPNQDTDTFRVFIRKNQNSSSNEESNQVYIDITPKMKWKQFLKASGKKLGIKAVNVYVPTRGGNYNEIKFLDELKNGDIVVISEGEDFNGGKNGGMKRKASDEKVFVSVLGAGGVGKSALTLRFVRNFFVQDWDPTIEDAYRKQVQVDGKSCNLELLDTAGQDDYEALRHTWMTDRDAYIFVFSVDKAASLDELNSFFELHERINGKGSNFPIILVGNKKDLTDENPGERKVSLNEGRKRAERFGATYIETSAANGEHVNHVFETLIRKVRQKGAPANQVGPQCCNIM